MKYRFAKFLVGSSAGSALLRAVLGAVAAVSAAACGSEPADRPPPLSSGSTTQLGGTGSPTSSSEAEGGGPGSNPAEQAEGIVERILDSKLVLTEPYRETATVSIWETDSSNGSEVHYDGSSFTTPLTHGSKWMSVVPEFDTTHIPTMMLWDGEELEPSLRIVPRSVLAEILGGLITSSTINDARAHLLVKVVDRERRAGLAGVKPTVLGGPDLALEEDGVWSDVDDQTSSSGLFLSYNIPARALPGQEVNIILEGAVQAEVVARIAQGSLTMATFEVE